MFRLNLAKASAFSLLILFLGIYCLFKRQNWLLFLLSFLYVWSYGGFLLILLVTAVYILADSLYSAFISKSWLEVFKIKLRIYKLKDHWRKFFKNLFSLANIKLGFASLSGIILGVVISPYFPRNLKFYWQQVVEIGLINYRDQVNVGGEWYPMSWADLLVKIGVLSVFVLIALLLFFVFIKKQNSYSIFFFFLSVLFIGLTLKSQRYIEYSTPFVACFAAFTFSNFLQEIDWRHWWRELGKDFLVLRYFICVLALLVAICFPFFMIKSLEETKKSYQSGFSFNVFAGVSEYLRENSQNGDIVMHTDWSDWPMLFYQNHQNYYIVGLDPTFMYKYNPALYRLFEDITMSRKASRLYLDIKEVFRAKYFIVNEGRDQLSRDLEKSGHFIKVYQDQDAAVYKVYP